MKKILFLLLATQLQTLQAQTVYTDYLPDYKINSKGLAIEKIDYSGDKMVVSLYISFEKQLYTKLFFYPPQDSNAWFLYDKQEQKKYDLQALRAVRCNGKLLADRVNTLVEYESNDTIPRYEFCQCELHFPLPKKAVEADIIEGVGNEYKSNYFNFFTIAIKKSNDPKLGTVEQGKSYQEEMRAKLLRGDAQSDQIGKYSPPTVLKPKNDLPTTREKNLTQALYFKQYEKKKCACDHTRDYTASVRNNLFSTALMNDLSDRFGLGIDLEAELYQKGDEIYGLNVFWKGEGYSFYNCLTTTMDTIVTFDPNTFQEIVQVQPVVDAPYPMVDGFIDATLLTNFPKLQYKLASFDSKTSNWDLLEGQIGYDAHNRLLFVAHKNGNYFLKRRVYASEKRAEEIGYDLTTAKKTHEGNWSIEAPKRETIRTYDPDRFEEIEQIVETPGEWLQQGTWRYYNKEGKIEREEMYKNGVKQ